ncbi:13901_t:CDS:2 [Entrophospora sp. SA101]|nr:13901_t:CDS:2 [Entrophospora sp. SA101]CAJ0888534.1 4237_t:CDS:2 [Entrophospora sp. SA101]
MAIAVESNELNMDICVEKVNELNKNVCVKEVDQLTDAIEPNELNKDVGVSVEVNEMTVAVESNESNKDVGVEVNEVADAIEVNGMADANELNKDVCIEVNELIGAVETHELNKDVILLAAAADRFLLFLLECLALTALTISGDKMFVGRLKLDFLTLLKLINLKYFGNQNPHLKEHLHYVRSVILTREGHSLSCLGVKLVRQNIQISYTV